MTAREAGTPTRLVRSNPLFDSPVIWGLLRSLTPLILTSRAETSTAIGFYTSRSEDLTAGNATLDRPLSLATGSMVSEWPGS
jgi:hypothetical protein